MQALIIIILVSVSDVFSLNLKLISHGVCDKNKKYALMWSGEIKDNVIIQGGINVSRPLGDLPAKFELEYSTDGKNQFKFASLNSKSYCQDVHNYAGEYMSNIERAANMPHPGTCPMAKGNFRLSNYPMDFSQFKLQALPKGHLKLTTHAYDPETKREIICLISRVTNFDS